MGEVAFVEEALKKIQGHKGVRGIIVINGDGIPIRHDMSEGHYMPNAGVNGRCAVLPSC